MNKEELLFAKSHEWIAPAGERRRVGISDFAQSQMGDIVYVEFPDDDSRDIAAGEEALVIESCKATASVYSPVSGRIVAYNRDLADAPERINQDPYDGGWLFEIEVSDQPGDLMDHAKYLTTCNEE